MRILVTGVAGFIGFHVAKTLLDQGHDVIGIDNINDYYDITLKHARLQQLSPYTAFIFKKASVADREAILPLAQEGITHIIHLAAQAGVRYSLKNPYAYVESNIMGQVVMHELARATPHLQHFVFASSSSVYGGNSKIPFSTTDAVDQPLSLYAATKRADELMAYTYAHLYGIPMTGLRFFTVYGPWGRPDMAPYIFARCLAERTPITLYNHGNMRRDFTYIDDIVSGVIGALHTPPRPQIGQAPYAVYNLGNSRAEKLTDFVTAFEEVFGYKAVYDLQPLQPGDVRETYADITTSTRDFGYTPTTSIHDGVPRFVAWYRHYHTQ